MKQIKYLNAVLTVIAFCLIMITLAVTGLLPTANAENTKSANNKFIQVPVNDDGSVNVRFSPKTVLDVNIEDVDQNAFMYAEPIQVKIKD